MLAEVAVAWWRTFRHAGNTCDRPMIERHFLMQKVRMAMDDLFNDKFSRCNHASRYSTSNRGIIGPSTILAPTPGGAHSASILLRTI